jgi:hypothetical protein
MALEKVGFCDASLMGYLTKFAEGEGMSVQDLRKRVTEQQLAKGTQADPAMLARLRAGEAGRGLTEAQSKVKDLEWQLNNAQAGRGVEQDLLAKAKAEMEANNAFHAQQQAAMKGQLGAATGELEGMGKLTRGFGKFKPWQKGMAGGAAGLATLGLGAGLGHALSD